MALNLGVHIGVGHSDVIVNYSIIHYGLLNDTDAIGLVTQHIAC